MSSSTYSAEIRPHKRLRRIVLLSGLIMSLIGVIVIVLLPISAAGRTIAAAGWFFWSGRELLTYWKVYGRWIGYSLSAEGEAQVFGRGEKCTAKVLPGSIVLAEVAWLRLQAENGDKWGELLAGDHRESEEWRRFQVIFRHLNTC